jgi:inositol-phosphate transport system permease protein
MFNVTPGEYQYRKKEVKLEKEKRNLIGLWFMIPAILLVIVFFFIPVIITIGISMTDMSSVTGFSAWKWVGFKNYVKIAQHPDSITNFIATLKYVGLTLIFFNVGLGLLIAIITNHLKKSIGGFFRSAWLLPRITPPVVYVLMWSMLAADAPYGVINQLFRTPFGLSTSNWIPEYAFLFIILVNGYIGASFGMLIFSSAIEAIPQDIMVSSLVDGASYTQRIRHIIIPQLRWPLLFVVTYQTLSLLTSFEYIMILTDGNFNTEVWSLWSYHKALNNYWGNFQYGFGAALAAVLVVVGTLLGVIYMKYFRFDALVQEPKIDEL